MTGHLQYYSRPLLKTLHVSVQWSRIDLNNRFNFLFFLGPWKATQVFCQSLNFFMSCQTAKLACNQDFVFPDCFCCAGQYSSLWFFIQLNCLIACMSVLTIAEQCCHSWFRLLWCLRWHVPSIVFWNTIKVCQGLWIPQRLYLKVSWYLEFKYHTGKGMQVVKRFSYKWPDSSSH